MKIEWIVIYILVYSNLYIQCYENKLVIKKLTKKKKKLLKRSKRLKKQANYEKRVYKSTTLGFCILDKLNDIDHLHNQIVFYQKQNKSLKLQRNSVLKLLLQAKIFIPYNKFANWEIFVGQKAA